MLGIWALCVCDGYVRQLCSNAYVCRQCHIIIIFMVEQANGDAAMDEEESFFDLVTRFQSKRMDDQRCSLTVIDNKENQIMGSIHGNPLLH